MARVVLIRVSLNQKYNKSSTSTLSPFNLNSLKLTSHTCKYHIRAYYITLHLPLQIIMHNIYIMTTYSYMCSISLFGGFACLPLLVVLTVSLVAPGMSKSVKSSVCSNVFKGIKCFLFLLYLPPFASIS